MKVRGIVGGESGDVGEITILNRRLAWKGNVMKYKADPKHAELVTRGVSLEAQSKGLDKPAVKETMAEVEDEELNEFLPP